MTNKISILRTLYLKHISSSLPLPIAGKLPGYNLAGLFPEEDYGVFEEFGRKLKERSESLVGDCKGEGNTVILKFKSSTQINQIEIQEDISKGEHIRSYYVEGIADGNWIRLCKGTSVGHKRIQLFDPVNVRSLRLTVENSGGLPSIRRFAAYNYQSANPE